MDVVEIISRSNGILFHDYNDVSLMCDLIVSWAI